MDVAVRTVVRTDLFRRFDQAFSIASAHAMSRSNQMVTSRNRATNTAYRNAKNSPVKASTLNRYDIDPPIIAAK